MAKLRTDQEGVSHLPGCSINTFETLCGFCDTRTRYEDKEGTPTCRGCIAAAKDLMKAATAKEIKSWRAS